MGPIAPGGVHVSYVSHLECGNGRLPSRKLIIRLAEALDGDRDELLHLAGKGDEEVVELRHRVEDLQSEVQRLKEQLEALETQAS